MDTTTFSRRMLLGGAAMLPSACSNLRAPSPPTEPEGQLRPDEELALTSVEGIACGVGFAAWMNKLSWLRRDSNGEDRPYRFMFNQVGTAQDYAMPLTRARGKHEDDGAIGIETTPFAFRLPAGRYAITRFQVYGLTRITIGPPYLPQQYNWSSQAVPPCIFDIPGGQVTYVGRFGHFSGVVSFENKETQDAACRPPDNPFSSSLSDLPRYPGQNPGRGG